MKILITGAAGQIGSGLSKLLIENGLERNARNRKEVTHQAIHQVCEILIKNVKMDSSTWKYKIPN